MPAPVTTLTALRAQLTAADPHRPAISRMGRVEIEFLLSEIAAGGPIFPHPDQVAPIGTVRWSFVTDLAA